MSPTETMGANEPHAARAGPASLLWSLAAAVAVAAAVTFSPRGRVLPAAAVSSLVFALGQAFFPHVRLRREQPLCPLHWALLVFFLQLVVLPLSVVAWGPSRGTLPRLPGWAAVNAALWIGSAAYLAFCLVYERAATRPPSDGRPGFGDPSRVSAPEGGTVRAGPRDWRRRLAAFYILLGLSGLGLAFGTGGHLLHYLRAPWTAADSTRDLAGTVRGLSGLLLRPFLIYGLVLLWSEWMDRRGTTAARRRAWTVTGACAIALAPVGLSFSFNRAALVVPVLAMAAAYSARIRRISLPALAAGGLVLGALALAVGAYRSANEALLSVRPAVAAELLADRIRPLETIQVYGGAPQFLGFLLEQTGNGRTHYLGRTLVSSLMYPIPVLGKPFRETSGPVLYNRLIYGRSGVLDQVIPFEGELYLNFGLAGVLVGFGALGWLISRLQRSFESATHTADAYMIQYVAIWALFLVQGSLAVVSQIVVYFFWPLWGYVLARRWQRRVLPRTSPTA